MDIRGQCKVLTKIISQMFNRYLNIKAAISLVNKSSKVNIPCFLNRGRTFSRGFDLIIILMILFCNLLILEVYLL